MTQTANWHYPTEIFFSAGEIKNINLHLRTINSKNPLYVIDKNLMQLGAINNLLSANNISEQGIFSSFSPNPSVTDVEAGIKSFINCNCDAIVAIGGGSAIDVGKTIALCAKQNRPVFDFEDCDNNHLRADQSLIAPIIAIPTTAGTGSEVGRAAAIIDEQCLQKKLIFHPQMLPSIVIADPLLHLSLPPHLTAATGMDALTHCIEAYCAPGLHPLADGIALEGIRIANDWLETAYNEPENIQARGNMLCVSIMGATAFQKGLGAVHSLSHPVGAKHKAHHGLLNAIFLPYVLQSNFPKIRQKLEHIAHYINLPQKNASAVISRLQQLNLNLNIPSTLKTINISANDADAIASAALHDPSSATNPMPLTQQLLKKIYITACNGVETSMHGETTCK